MQSYLNHTFSTEDFDLVSVIDELPLWSAPFGLDLLDMVKLKPNIVALDVSCGLGFPLIELANRLGNSSKVFGIDPWKKATERVNLKIKTLDIKNVEVLNGVAEELPFDNNYFDMIVSNNGVNNLNSMKLALSECHRVIKSGAQFVITFNLKDTMIEFYNIFFDILRTNRLFSEIEKMKSQIYLKRKPLSEVESILKESGFTIRNIKYNKFNISFLDGTTMFNHSLIKYWFLDGWKKILKSGDLVWIFEQIENRINAIAKKKGEFCLTIPYITIDSIKECVTLNSNIKLYK